MPFKSSKQSKACFATNGFNGKIDCEEWAKETNYMKFRGKQRGGEMYQQSLLDRMRNGIQSSNDPRLQGNDPGMQLPVDPLIKFSPFSTNAQGIPADEVLPDPGTPQVGNPVTAAQAEENDKKKKKQFNPMDPYFALQGAQTGLAWLAGMKDRGRQNQYMYDQYSTLGQSVPANTADYQPNPFSLYAKYGGKIKMQKGGKRLVQQVPQGYAPIAGMPDHYQRTANVGLAQAQAGSGQGTSPDYGRKMQEMLSQGVTMDELVNKGYGTKQGLAQYQGAYRPMSDTVYTQRPAAQPIQPQTSTRPLAAWDGQMVYDGADKATGMYRFNTRAGQAPTSAITNSTGNWQGAQWTDVDGYGRPTGDAVDLNNEQFNRAFRGTNKLFDRPLIDSLRSVQAPMAKKKKYGGKVKNNYRGE